MLTGAVDPSLRRFGREPLALIGARNDPPELDLVPVCSKVKSHPSDKRVCGLLDDGSLAVAPRLPHLHEPVGLSRGLHRRQPLSTDTTGDLRVTVDSGEISSILHGQRDERKARSLKSKRHTPILTDPPADGPQVLQLETKRTP